MNTLQSVTHPLTHSSTTVNARDHLVKGNAFHEKIGYILFWLIAPIGFILITVFSYGIALVGGIIWLVRRNALEKQAAAQIHGSAIKLSELQFPEIHASALRLAAKLGMTDAPDIYIMENNQQNAFAIKVGKKNTVILTDDIVYGCLDTGNQAAIDFILAHELAHHALGHPGVIRSYIRNLYKKLSRLDEFSCDNIALVLTGNQEAAKRAFALLMSGPQLFSKVNVEALDAQAAEVDVDKHTRPSERKLTHPLLLRRYARLLYGAKI